MSDKDETTGSSISGFRLFSVIAICGLYLLSVSVAGATDDGGESDDGSFKDSVVNIWDKVSGATVKGSKIVKEKSIELGHEVGDKAVDAWDWATEDDSAGSEMDEGAFGDDRIGVDDLQENYDKKQEEAEESFTGKVERSAVELWSKVAESFAGDEEAGGGYPSPEGLWDEVHGELSEIAEKMQQQEVLPDSSLLSDDKQSNKKKIDKLLTRVLEVLEVTNVSERKQEYADLEDEIRQENVDIATYKEKMILAPEKVDGIDKVWTDTRADLKQKIADSQDKITKLKQQQQDLLAAIKEELLNRSGIKLSDDQVYSLVVMVSGDSFVTLNSIFYNVKQLVGILEKFVAENQDYVNSVKKYYGMYAVLIQALEMAHDVEIQRIRDGYIPKLDEFRVRAQLATRDTKALLEKNKGNPQNTAILEQNLRAQAEVFTAAGAYKDYLSDYLQRLQESRKVIAGQLLVVMDTWKTTQLASGLLAVMQSSSAGLNDLVSMKLPSIKPLDVGRLKDQLSMISLEIRE